MYLIEVEPGVSGIRWDEGDRLACIAVVGDRLVVVSPALPAAGEEVVFEGLTIQGVEQGDRFGWGALADDSDDVLWFTQRDGWTYHPRNDYVVLLDRRGPE